MIDNLKDREIAARYGIYIEREVMVGHNFKHKETGTYNDHIPQGIVSTAGLSFGNSELYEHVGKDKHCPYCGNVNAPDARRCCGCQHAI